MQHAACTLRLLIVHVMDLCMYSAWAALFYLTYQTYM